MAAIYVTSLSPGAGKTAVAASLVSLLRGRGRRATYCKPLAITAGDNQAAAVDPDALFCKEALALPDGLRVIAPIPITADAISGGLGEVGRQLHEKLTALSATTEVLVIEGLPASGPTAAASRELAQLAEAWVIAVVRYRRGMDLEPVKALQTAFAGRLLGVILNAVPALSLRAARDETAPALKRAGIGTVAIIPEDRLLLGFTVAEYAALLGGRVLNNPERTGEIVEGILVGALALDPGEHYYQGKESKALITRGDRPDLQFGAVEASLRCLILTKGAEPIPYVLEKAKEAEVPIMVVPKDTLETIAQVESFVTKPTFHHPRKLTRFTELLQQELDIGTLGV